MRVPEANLELLRSTLSHAYPVRAVTSFDALLQTVDLADETKWGRDLACPAKTTPPLCREQTNSDGGGSAAQSGALESVEFLLFDSLVHHLIEKGLLTKNDALSVIQTVAGVVQGRLETGPPERATVALSSLERTYGSFQALPDRHGRPGLDADNIVALRPPLHGEHPQFPSNDQN